MNFQVITPYEDSLNGLKELYPWCKFTFWGNIASKSLFENLDPNGVILMIEPHFQDVHKMTRTVPNDIYLWSVIVVSPDAELMSLAFDTSRVKFVTHAGWLYNVLYGNKLSEEWIGLRLPNHLN